LSPFQRVGTTSKRLPINRICVRNTNFPTVLFFFHFITGDSLPYSNNRKFETSVQDHGTMMRYGRYYCAITKHGGWHHHLSPFQRVGTTSKRLPINRICVRNTRLVFCVQICVVAGRMPPSPMFGYSTVIAAISHHSTMINWIGHKL
jgi:hypothetical protein